MHRSLVALIAALLLVVPRSADAAWHGRSGDLPGLVSGKNIAITFGVIGGGAVGTILLVRHIKNKKNRARSQPRPSDRVDSGGDSAVRVKPFGSSRSAIR